MVEVFVLVGGWPGSGKSTLAAALGPHLGVPVPAKDEIKQALVGGLGPVDTVAESRRVGRAAVLVALRVAARCPGAVVDSTWFDYTRPLVAALPGPVVEVRCGPWGSGRTSRSTPPFWSTSGRSRPRFSARSADLA
ncbi:MAG: hypothetical protein ABIQ18_02260 [Umezawaea sp.]